MLTEEKGMFPCERIPGGLLLTETACAKLWNRAKNNPEALKECVGCKIGEGSDNRNPGLRWKIPMALTDNSKFNYLRNRDEYGLTPSLQDVAFSHINHGTIVPAWEKNNINERVFVFSISINVDPGVQSLLWSVLYHSLKIFMSTKDPIEKRFHKKWLLSKNAHKIFSSARICEVLEINHNRIIKLINEEHKEN